MQYLLILPLVLVVAVHNRILRQRRDLPKFDVPRPSFPLCVLPGFSSTGARKQQQTSKKHECLCFFNNISHLFSPLAAWFYVKHLSRIQRSDRIIASCCSWDTTSYSQQFLFTPTDSRLYLGTPHALLIYFTYSWNFENRNFNNHRVPKEFVTILSDSATLSKFFLSKNLSKYIIQKSLCS